MKKITVTLLAIIMLAAFAVIPASAVNYTNGAFSVNVPDNLVEDKASALEYDMTMTWVSEDENFDFSLSVEPNDDNYTYVNYSKSDIQDIYNDYIEGYDEAAYTLNSGENITVGGFEGVKLDMTLDFEGAKMNHIVCAFSTKTEVYTLYFYVYDDAYAGYVDEIINAVVIDGNDYDAEAEGNIQYAIYLAVVMAVSAIISKIKKNKAKKKGVPAEYQPISNENGTNVVFNPETDFNNAEPSEEAPKAEEYAYKPSENTGFAAKEAERERKEREELFK